MLGRVGLHLKFYQQEKGGQRLYRLDAQKPNDPDRTAVLESLTQKWAKLSSSKEFSESQQSFVDIIIVVAAADCKQVSISSVATPEEHRGGLREMCEWLAEACSDTRIKDILEVAAEFSGYFPKHGNGSGKL